MIAKNLYKLSLLIMLVGSSSCATHPSIIGFWQNSQENDSIEFKADGKVVILDNMSTTTTGTYRLVDDNSLKVEITATDILRESLESVSKTVFTAQILILNREELKLRILEEALSHDEGSIEIYRRQ